MDERYEVAYRRSLEEPEAFWAEAAKAIHWSIPPRQILDASKAPFYRWFRGGRMNTCHNALDRHVAAGYGDQTALIHDSPVTGKIHRFTYAELTSRVARFAGALARLGVGIGDRVLIYMPMVPEGVIAMLAAARLGAIHSVVFGGFAAPELASRIDHARPKVLVFGSAGIEPNRIVPYKPMVDQALGLAQHRPSFCVLFQREEHRAEPVPARDVDWHELEAAASPHPPVDVDATDPLYILYTSGTTGMPKGVVRDNGGHAVALSWSLPNVFDVHPGEVFWSASDLGWAVGHSYIVYAPLLARATTILYEGKPVGTPDAGAFWRVMAEHRAVTMFTAPTAFRAIRREDPNGERLRDHDLSRLRALFLAGERCDPSTLRWAEQHLAVPVIDNYWQTETGWPIVANCLGLGRAPVKPGSPTRAVPGWDVRALDAATGEDMPRGQTGDLALKLPMPPGGLLTMWENDEGYVRSYLDDLPGFYKTADAGYVDEDGYVFVMARTDDIINVAGHRLSTGAMEEVLSNHPDVAECAVIGVADELKGQLPLGLLVLKAGVTRDPSLVVTEVVQMVREHIGAVVSFKTAIVVERLPKTRSGKILRGTMQKIADGVAHKVPATIDEPAILPEIEAHLRKAGYPRG